jgi:hypothetical protein
MVHEHVPLSQSIHRENACRFSPLNSVAAFGHLFVAQPISDTKICPFSLFGSGRVHKISCAAPLVRWGWAVNTKLTLPPPLSICVRGSKSQNQLPPTH